MKLVETWQKKTEERGRKFEIEDNGMEGTAWSYESD